MNSNLCITKPYCEIEAAVKKKASYKDTWRSGNSVKKISCELHNCFFMLKQIRILVRSQTSPAK